MSALARIATEEPEQTVARRLDDLNDELLARVAEMGLEVERWRVQLGQLRAAIGDARDEAHGLPRIGRER